MNIKMLCKMDQSSTNLRILFDFLAYLYYPVVATEPNNVAEMFYSKILTSTNAWWASKTWWMDFNFVSKSLKNIMMNIMIVVSWVCVHVSCNNQGYCFKTRLFFCGWMNSSMTPPTMEFNRAFTDSRLLGQERSYVCAFAKKCRNDRINVGEMT